MNKNGTSILLGIVLIFSSHFICFAAPLNEAVQPLLENLFSPQEIKSCEEIISVALAAFKEKKYDLLHDYFFQPPYYDAQDIKDDREYVVSLLKMAEEELGDLEDCSVVPFDSIPRNGWYCFGESIFLNTELKSYSKLYLKTYKAIFSKIKSFPVYIYIRIYIGVDKDSIRDFGIVLPSIVVFNEPTSLDPYAGIKEIKNINERKTISSILFLQSRIMKHYAESSGEGYKAKLLADTPIDKKNIVKYSLPTKEGKFITFWVNYVGYDSGFPEDAEIQQANFDPPLELQKGEQIYTFLTEQNEPLKIEFSFENGKIINTKLELDSIKEEKETGEKKISVVSQKGFLVDFDLRYGNGEISNVNVHPRVNPFGAGSTRSFLSSEEILELKKSDISKVKEELRRELNLDQEK